MKYFAIIDGKQEGPYSIEELVQAGVHPDTYVWCKGMTDWTQARYVADICRHFRRRLFDKMHPPAIIKPAQLTPDTPHATDEQLRSMKMRDAWREISRQIVETQPDPAEQEATPPASWWPFPILIAIICFFPLGIPAYIYDRKAQHLWHKGQASRSHECARLSKLLAGMAIAAACFTLGATIMLSTR